MIHTGYSGQYQWLVSRTTIRPLPDLVLRFHEEMRLYITAFDSGPIHPSSEELTLGWRLQGKVMVSPPLHRTVVLPYDNFDEWYIFDPPQLGTRRIETFVSYSGFSVRPAEEIRNEADPASEECLEFLDSLAQLQRRFWDQLASLNPRSFIAMGDNDVVVSKERAFIEAVWDAAQQAGAEDTNGTGH